MSYELPSSLLKNCRHKKNIYCYGAGHYGSVVRCFLEMHGIPVKAFIVTRVEEDSPYEVVPWDNISADDLAGGLVILSLHEKFQDEVRKMILEKSGKVETFPVTDGLFEKLPQAAHDMALKKRICRENPVSEPSRQYEQMAREILGRYERIVLRYIYSDRIGSLALNWIYYCSVEHHSGELWLFYPGPSQRIVNVFLDKKVKEKTKDYIEVIGKENIRFWQYMLANHGDRIIAEAALPDEDYFASINRQISALDKSKEISFMNLSAREEAAGKAFLEKFGLQDFVLVFARDSCYTQKEIGAAKKQDAVFGEYRNLPIASFSAMAEYLGKNNIGSVRMGSMPVDDAPSAIFDYGREHHDDFLDVYLCSHCRYFVGTPSGLQHIADLFGKLMVMVNVPVLSTENNFAFVGGRENLMILQKYWDSKNERYLTIREMLQYEFYGKSEYAPNGPRRTMWLYHENGIEPVKNTEEEILAVVKEMEERLAGTICYDAADINLQDKFQMIIDEFEDSKHFFFNYRIGRDFLRENKWLLD